MGADRLREQYLLRLREAGIPQANPQALILCDLIDFRLGCVEQDICDAIQTADKAFNKVSKAKDDLHAIKTRGESA